MDDKKLTKKTQKKTHSCRKSGENITDVSLQNGLCVFLDDKKNANKFNCPKCNYHSNNKYDFSRHLSTSKHKKVNIKKNKDYKCDKCHKVYHNRQSLWKHKKKNVPS